MQVPGIGVSIQVFPPLPSLKQFLSVSQVLSFSQELKNINTDKTKNFNLNLFTAIFYRINFLYLILFGIKSPPKRFFLFNS